MGNRRKLIIGGKPRGPAALGTDASLPCKAAGTLLPAQCTKPPAPALPGPHSGRAEASKVTTGLFCPAGADF